MIVEFPKMYIKGAAHGEAKAEVVSLETVMAIREQRAIYEAAIEELNALVTQMETWLD